MGFQRRKFRLLSCFDLRGKQPAGFAVLDGRPVNTGTAQPSKYDGKLKQ
jgi:hypothetical protein